MDWTSNVAVHQTALPEVTRERILDALRRAELDPFLLYSGLRQTLLWVELYRAFSPARKNPNGAALYEIAFGQAAALCQANVIHLVSLAAGDGSKDARCLDLLRESAPGRAVIYTPSDISLEMVLTAERTACRAVPGLQSTPLLCDLSRCSVLPALLKTFDPSGTERLVLFLGTIHNFWPPEILRSVLYPVRSQDQLLIGANMAPAENYDAALNGILPQYDNAPTHAWLMGALSEINIGATDGTLAFSLQPAENLPTLKRIQADFIFGRAKEVHFFGETISFAPGQKLRVFYSYRFTAEHLRAFLTQAGLRVAFEWSDANNQEGLFLCRRNA